MCIKKVLGLTRQIQLLFRLVWLVKKYLMQNCHIDFTIWPEVHIHNVLNYRSRTQVHCWYLNYILSSRNKIN